MRTLEDMQFTIDISQEVFNEMMRETQTLRHLPEDRLKKYLFEHALSNFGISDSDPFLQEFSEFLSKESLSIRVLFAHGLDSDNKWTFSKGTLQKGTVQEWISRYDGLYDLLVLHCCNPGHYNPQVSQSLALVPSDDVSGLLRIAGVEHRLVVPWEGQAYFNRYEPNSLDTFEQYVAGIQEDCQIPQYHERRVLHS